MTENPGQKRRRRRRRASSAQGPPPPQPAAEARPVPSPAPPEPPRKRRGPREPGERGLRDLVGAGSSQLGVSGALRGRDVNRPTDEDLAAAERDVVIVRRNWKPDDKR